MRFRVPFIKGHATRRFRIKIIILMLNGLRLLVDFDRKALMDLLDSPYLIWKVWARIRDGADQLEQKAVSFTISCAI